MTDEIRNHLSKDPVLKKVIEARTLEPLVRGRNLYEALIRSIVGQQLSVKAADTIYGRFLDLFPTTHPAEEELIATDHEVLRSCGLSNSKANYVRNVATYFLENKTADFSSMENEEIVKELTTIKGVGVWTVEMILMFSLHRPDVFPIGDLGVRNGMIELYEVKIENKKELYAELTRIAEAWKPYRSFGARFMWRWLDADAAGI